MSTNFSKFHENPFSISQTVTGKNTRGNDGKHNSGSFHCKTKLKLSQYKHNKPQKDRQNTHITTVNLLSKETSAGSLLSWFTQQMSSSVCIPVIQPVVSPLPKYLTQIHTWPRHINTNLNFIQPFQLFVCPESAQITSPTRYLSSTHKCYLLWILSFIIVLINHNYIRFQPMQQGRMCNHRKLML